MVENWAAIHEIQAKIKLLSPGDQLYLVQQIAGVIRSAHFTDHQQLQKAAEEMANDPDIQRVLRNEDLPGLEEEYLSPEAMPQRAAS